MAYRCCAFSGAFALIASGALAGPITVVDGNADAGAGLVDALVDDTIVVNATDFIGGVDQSGFFGDDDTAPIGPGVILTTGSADFDADTAVAPPSALVGTGSNAALEAALTGPGGLTPLAPGDPINEDQNVLTFEFTTADPTATSIALDFLFATTETGALLPANPDAFGVFVDGVNFATFSNGALATATTIPSVNVNTESLPFFDAAVTNPLTLVGLLDPDLATHTISIVIADAFDLSFDSGLILSGLTQGFATEGGIIAPIPLPGAPLLMLTGLAGVGFAARGERQSGLTQT